MSKFRITDLRGTVHTVLVDKEDDELMRTHNWTVYTRAGRPYAIRGRSTALHREIIGVEYKRPQCIDHINGNTLDNRRANLRLVHDRDNVQNSKKFKSNTTGYRGVSFKKDHGTFEAAIWQNRKRIWLGYYDTAKEAADAYDAKAIELYGPLAYTNAKGSLKMRTCIRCKETKEVTEFYTFKRKKADGTDLNYFSSCKVCSNARWKKNYRSSPAARAAHNAYVRKWRMKNHDEVLEYQRKIHKVRYHQNPSHVRLVQDASSVLRRNIRGESLEDILNVHRTWTQEYREKVVAYIIEKRLA